MAEVTLEPEILNLLPPFRRALRRASLGLRRELPWIGLNDPWAIFVSEVMLQQTSTGRVIEPWRRFLSTYPTPTACARAPLADVLRLWSGLGYPRRAKSLRDAAQVMTDRFDGHVPSSVEDLVSLAGVGPYTAHAVASFAFGRRVAVLDTNVGRVLARAIANRPLRPREAQDLATALLPRKSTADFNQALLDLGAQWCVREPRCAQCPVRAQCRWQREGGDDPAPRSAAVSRPQAAFAGSDRQVRGRILRALNHGALSQHTLAFELYDIDAPRLVILTNQLRRDGLISDHDERLALSGDDETSH
jgi:A/G-specific adenine glycosylase